MKRVSAKRTSRGYSGSVAVPKRYFVFEYDGKWQVSSNSFGKNCTFNTKEEAEDKLKELSK